MGVRKKREQEDDGLPKMRSLHQVTEEAPQKKNRKDKLPRIHNSAKNQPTDLEGPETSARHRIFLSCVAENSHRSHLHDL